MRVEAGVDSTPGYRVRSIDQWLYSDNKFDGDMMSFIFVMSDDANAEIDRVHNSAKYYLDPTGKIAFSGSCDTIDMVMAGILS